MIEEVVVNEERGVGGKVLVVMKDGRRRAGKKLVTK